jgi:hypothetical protein
MGTMFVTEHCLYSERLKFALSTLVMRREFLFCDFRVPEKEIGLEYALLSISNSYLVAV